MLAAAAPGCVAAGTVAYLTGEIGGYYAPTWGWASVVLLAIAAGAVLLLPAVRLGRLELALLASVAALAAWTGLSWAWSGSPPQAVAELERCVLYLAGIGTFLLLGRRQSLAWTAGALLGVIAGYSCYALATRFYPVEVPSIFATAGGRLGGPFAYANAMGLFSGIGLLLAFGLAGHRSLLVRLLAAATTVPLALALGLTYSRGSWIALAIGALTIVLLSDRSRELVLRLVLLAPAPAFAVWLASRSTAITGWEDLAAADRDGRQLTVACIVLVVCSVLTLLLGTVGGRTHWLARPAMGGIAVLVVGLGVVSLSVAPSGPPRLSPVAAGSSSQPQQSGAGTTTTGSPTQPEQPGAATAAPPPAQTSRPIEHLTSLGSSYRTEMWRVALGDFARHPLIGSGAGSYQSEWFQHRRINEYIRNAHSLFLETLAELGLVGIALLLAVVAIPALAAVRLRAQPLVPVLGGAYAAGIAHAAIDWDWQMPAAMFVTLFCGAALVAAAGSAPVRRRSASPLLRPGALALTLALLAFSIVGLAGNRAEASALAAARRLSWPATDAAARRASDWAPWAAEPLLLQGYAALARGDGAAASTLIRRAAQMQRGDWVYWYYLGSVTTGSEREAALARAARLNPLALPAAAR